MEWLYLAIAGIAEIVFALSLKYNQGFTRLWPSIVTMVSGGASFYLLMLAIRTLPVGTAYAVWTGMDAVGVAIKGINRRFAVGINRFCSCRDRRT